MVPSLVRRAFALPKALQEEGFIIVKISAVVFNRGQVPPHVGTARCKSYRPVAFQAFRAPPEFVRVEFHGAQDELEVIAEAI